MVEGWRYGYDTGPLLMICENEECSVFVVGVAPRTPGDA